MAGPRMRPPRRAPSGPARKLTAAGVDRGRRLADFLADRLGLSATDAEALVRRGSVYVGRRRVEDPAHPLAAGDQLTVHAAGDQPTVHAAAAPSTGTAAAPLTGAAAAPLTGTAAAPLTGAAAAPLTGAARWPAADLESWVVHRDADVLVIDKPPGVPSQATRAASAGALDRMVREVLDPEARLLHRLDRGASGLVLFTRTAAAHRRFAELLASGRLERTYLAAAWGHWTVDTGELTGSIGRDPHDHRRMAVGPGRPALTRFRVIRRGHAPGGEPVSLLELDLVTGRTHQIRVHLSHAGHPVCGDALYGPDRPPLERLFLHARRLAWPGAPPVVAPVPVALSDLIG